MDTLEYLNELLSEGEEVLNTKYDPNGGGDGFVVMGFRVTVDEIKFAKWQSKSIAFLEQILGTDDFRLKKFKEEVRNNFYDHVQIGIGILESIIEDIDRNNFKTEISKRNTELEPFLHIEAILNNFHEVVKQLSHRQRDREPLKINDEYDVQYLLNSLLRIHFNDVREEEPTPSSAGKSTKVDFLIKDCNAVIETKMARKTLKDKEVGNELILDIKRYSEHPSCDMLYCFIYDPKGYIRNQGGLKNDLEDFPSNMDVKIIICP